MLTWSTDGLPGGAQFGFWREVICEAFAALDPRPAVPPASFPSTVRLNTLGPVNVARIASCAQVVRRGPREIRLDPQDRLFVNLQLAGAGRVVQDDRTVAVASGSFCIVDTARPYRLEFDGAFEVLSFRVPRQHLLSMLVEPGQVVARPVSGAGGIGRLAASFMELLDQEADALPERRRGDLAAQLCQLLAAAMTEPAPVGSPRQRFRQAAIDFLDARLEDPGLSVYAVAERFGVSARHVQQVFAEAGGTVAGHIRAARLDRCARDLANSADQRQIAAIALGHGFGDIPHFTRLFSRRYGCSPRVFRARSAGHRG